MTQAPPTEEQVRRANRAVYNAKNCASYNSNRSIFTPRQRTRVSGILREIRDTTAGERFLDVGCGTGHLLLLARSIFPRVYGVDLAERLLAAVREREGIDTLLAGHAHCLPLPDQHFDGVGMYALLHHIQDPVPVLAEAFRVLRPGGVLYTDHDPNYYFGRFYHLWYRFQHRGSHGFGSAEEDVAEYHNVYTGGLDPEHLRRKLRGIGFRDVRVTYRQSTNEGCVGFQRLAMNVLRNTARVLPLLSLHTHFLIRARR